MPKLVLIVDDDPLVLDALRHSLRPHFSLRIATSAQRGLELARRKPRPDLVLLDVSLPDIHGYEVCRRLKQDAETQEIPVMFLSSHTDEGSVTHGLEIGAVDFVSKPVRTPILLARVKTHLRLKEAGELLRDQNLHLESLVHARTQDLEARTVELQRSQELAIVALGSIAETRDNETGNHIHRTCAYVRIMAERLTSLRTLNPELPPDQLPMLWKSAPLHDIGKVGIPDHILLKPGRLTEQELQVMRRHPAIGRDALRAAERRMGSEASFLAVAKEIAYAHHERWDGRGYPEGLSGTSIPLSARLMALADAYDAMTNRRVYKPAMPHEVAVEQIRAGRGSQFDPSLCDCFADAVDEFQAVALRFSDVETPSS